jgi:hypothetical protein
MDWGTKSNPALVEAIVRSFSDSPECSHRRLSSFSVRDWAQTEFWLDTSGLALYFLRHILSKNIESAIEPMMLNKLDEKLADNKRRAADMRDEFVAINRHSSRRVCVLFESEGIYAFSKRMPGFAPSSSRRLRFSH